jgi:membrane-associated phospholipid phosphatase
MRPVDTLTLGFLTFLFSVTLIFQHRIPHALILLITYLALVLSLLSLIFFKKRNDGKILEMTYDIIFPIIVVIMIFNSLGGLIRYINPTTYDHVLIHLDYRIFNAHPTVALEQITTPALTELLQLAYTSYYFLPIILCVMLKVKGREAEFNRSVFLIILCFFLSYIGYIIVPAIGPRYTIRHLQNIELHGILLRGIIDQTLNALEGIKRDAFPSGHTAVALTVLYLAYRFHKRLFQVFLPVVIALLISTVYLRYHYVVDVIAGILLFLFTVLTGEKYYSRREKERHNHSDEKN